MARSVIVVSLALLALAAAVSASVFGTEIGDCPQDGAMPDDYFTFLANLIAKTSFNDEKNKVLDLACRNLTRGFNGPQTVAMLQLFSFSDNMLRALASMNRLILGCTTAQVIEILKVFSFSSDRLKVLPTVMNIILDPANKYDIVDACFSMSSDKDAAKKILDGLIPRSCVFGWVVEPRVQFLIDVSGSMNEKFNNGNATLTRLSYVTNEIVTVLTKQLQPTQRFNVFSFSSDVRAWQPGLVPVNDANTKSAVSFCNGLRADGGTNIFAALQRAMADKDVVAIYLLTDGFPSVGVTDINQIILQTGQMARLHNPAVVVNTIALTIGGSESPVDRQKAKYLMEHLAMATGGVYRSIGSSTP